MIALPSSSSSILSKSVRRITASIRFSETLDSGGGGSHAYLMYSGDTLKVCSGREKRYYAFNRDGSFSTDPYTGTDELRSTLDFQGWQTSHRKKAISVNGNNYVYKEAPFPTYIFDNRCELYIEKSDGTRIVLYENEAN